MQLNVEKYHILEIRKSRKSLRWKYNTGNDKICKTQEEKGLGVIKEDNLSLERPITVI